MKLFILSLITLSLLASLAFSRKAVFAGGGLDDDNAAVYSVFVNISSPPGQQQYIGIITAASDPEDAQDNGAFYVDLLKTNYSATNVEWLPIDINHTSLADDPTIVAKLENMTGVFFGGGDQSRLITCFYRNGTTDTATLAVIRRRYESGDLAVGGTSAGTTIQQAAPMVSGGESWDALALGAFNETDTEDSDALTYSSGGGFRFFDYGFLDTHFATRGRQGRMMRLLNDLSANGTIGVGVDENTALVMNGDVFEVVGYNGAYIIDASHCQMERDPEAGGFTMDNLKLSYLTTGDIFNMTDSTITFASWKQDINGKQQNQNPMNPTLDLFSSVNDLDEDGDRKYPEMFTNVTTNLFNSALSKSTHGYTWETNPGFRLDFNKGDDSYGVIGVSGANTYISYSKLTTSVKCVSGCKKEFLGLQRRYNAKKKTGQTPLMELKEMFGQMEFPDFIWKHKFEQDQVKAKEAIDR